VNAFFAPDSFFTVSVSKNISATNIETDFTTPMNSHPAVTNAIVEVYEGNTWVEILPYVPASAKAGVQAIGVYRSKTNRAKAGKSYTLKVKAKDYPDASATATIPQPVPLTDYKFYPVYEGTAKKEIGVNFTLKDDGTDMHYYSLSYEIEAKDGGQYYYQRGGDAAIATSDLVLKSGLNFFDKFEISSEPIRYGFLLFPNDLFKGEIQECLFKIAPVSGHSEIDPNERFKIQVLSTNKDFYLYRYDFYNQAVGDGDPFSLPQRVHSNIEGGLGIFATYSIKSFYVQ
jgi:hypothetical protein